MCVFAINLHRSFRWQVDSSWGLAPVGISGISKDEASHLLNKTLPAPEDPDTYVIQLEVFHNLHCLNMLRMTIYPDQYPDMVAYHDNGTINHGTLQALHMGELNHTLLESLYFALSMLRKTDKLSNTSLDHCLDALRQSTMCEADVTPVTFLNNYFGRGVYPNLIATHTCRDFDALVNWAKRREVKNYQAN